MQGLERLLESVEGIFGLSGVYRALIVIAGQIPSTLRIIMILSPRANDISVYKLKKRNFITIGREKKMPYSIQEPEWTRNASTLRIRGITQTIAIEENQHLKVTRLSENQVFFLIPKTYLKPDS
jgi:hypothetical protein